MHLGLKGKKLLCTENTRNNIRMLHFHRCQPLRFHVIDYGHSIRINNYGCLLKIMCVEATKIK